MMRRVMNTDIENKLQKRGTMRMLDMHAHLYCLSEEFEMQSRAIREGERALKLCGKEGEGLSPGPAQGGTARLAAAERELALRKEHGIRTCFSGGNPVEWEFLSRLRGREELLFCFGVHPWYADRYDPERYGDLLKSCDILGEIGMDSVWCQVDLGRQRRVLERQLQMAADFHKPVVLHTKGQEAEIAGAIRGFPNPVCVHWYSGDEESLEAFLALDCYFTLGPDFASLCQSDPEALSDEEKEKQLLYRRMLSEIPRERLFLETDGITAVAWARNTAHLELSEIPAVLAENRAYLAAQKGKTEEEIQSVIEENLERFLGRV